MIDGERNDATAQSMDTQLDRSSTLAWTNRLDRLFRTAQDHRYEQDKQIAADLAMEVLGGTGADIRNVRSRLSKFKTADPATLRLWFGKDRGRWLVPLSELLGVGEDHFDRLLAEVRSPDTGFDDQPWHPAFPQIARGELSIPRRMYVHGSEISVEQLAARLLGATAASGDAAPWVWIVGPTGSGRRTAALQIADQLQPSPTAAVAETNPKSAKDATPKVGLLLEEPQGGWTLARAEAKAPTIAVAVRVPESVGRDDDLELSLRPWGPPELAALADELERVGALEADQANHCREFARRATADPAWHEELGLPYVVIQLARDIASGSEPQDPRDIRRRRTAAALARGLSVAPDRRLDALGEPLLARLWAEVIARSPVDEDWTRLREDHAVALLEEAAAGRPLLDPDAEALALVEELSLNNRRADRRRLADELKAVIAARPGEALLAALLAAGLLVKSAEGYVSAADSDTARLWAARGVADRGALDLSNCWERLAEPAWLEFVRELALAGLNWAALTAALESAPDWSALDSARAIVVFAAFTENDAAVADGPLTEAWGGSLAGMIHATFDADVHCVLRTVGHGEELGLLSRALVAVSRRYSGRLPWLDPADPIAGVLAVASEAVQQIAGQWSPLPDGAQEDAAGLGTVSLGSGPGEPVAMWADRRGPALVVGRLAPYQLLALQSQDSNMLDVPPDTPSEWGWPTEALARAAEMGHEGASLILAGCQVRRDAGALGAGETFDDLFGAPVVDSEAHSLWRTLPQRLRLGWAGRSGPADDEAWWRLSETMNDLRKLRANAERPDRRWPALQWLPADDELDEFVEALRRLGAEEARVRLTQRASRRGDRTTNRLFPSLELVLRVAERLEATEALEALIELPGRWLSDVRIRHAAGGTILVRRMALAEGDGQRQRWERVGKRGKASESPGPAWEILTSLHEIAVGAAQSLHRLGKPDAVLDLWRNGTKWSLSQRQISDARLDEDIRSALHCPHDELEATKVPTKACRALLSAICQEDDEYPLLELPPAVGQMAALREAAALPLDSDFRQCDAVRRLLNGKSDSGALASALAAPQPPSEPERLAILTIMALDLRCPEAVPDEVSNWLSVVAACRPSHNPGASPTCLDSVPDRLSESAKAGGWLLEAGVDEPLRDWLRDRPAAEDDRRSWRERDAVVSRKVRSSASMLDRAWRLGSDGPRRALLLQWAAPPAADEANPVRWLPRPWWGDAIATGKPAEMRFWARHHRQSPAVAAALRALILRARDPRERAAFALLLHRHERWCPELVDALRVWTIEVPDPLSGPHHLRVVEQRPDDATLFNLESVECSGGGADLLQLLEVLFERQPELVSPWLLPGARRLWGLFLDGDQDERGAGPIIDWTQEVWNPAHESGSHLGKSIESAMCQLLNAVGLGELVEELLWGADGSAAAAQEARSPGRLRWLTYAQLPHVASDRLMEVVRQGGTGRLEAARELARREHGPLVPWVLDQLGQSDPALPREDLLLLLQDASPEHLPASAERVLAASSDQERRSWLSFLARLAGEEGAAATGLRLLLRQWSVARA